MQSAVNPKNGTHVDASDEVETISVLKTTNYNQFTIITGNRTIDQHHVTRLISSIGKKNLLAYNPIIVNGMYHVIDGQHRLLAARALKTPIYYVIVNDIGLEEVRMLNTYNKTWTIYDYLTASLKSNVTPASYRA